MAALLSIGEFSRLTHVSVKHRQLGTDVSPRGGPDGVFYSAELFGSHVGEATAFIPLSAGLSADTLPQGRLAVAVHHGPLRELERTYAALGGYVAEQGPASPARTAIRENYLVGARDTQDEHGFVTEVCRPVPSTTAEEES